MMDSLEDIVEQARVVMNPRSLDELEKCILDAVRYSIRTELHRHGVGIAPQGGVYVYPAVVTTEHKGVTNVSEIVASVEEERAIFGSLAAWMAGFFGL